MALTPEARARLRQRSIQEAKYLLVLFAYLALLLSSFSLCRRLVLWEYHISYLHYGYSLIEAAILAKVIKIGELLHLAERFHDKPLIIPTLYKSLIFSLFVLFFSILEELIFGLFRGHSPAEILHHALTNRLYPILAQSLVIFIALIPFFAYQELGRLLTQQKLHEIFFKHPPTTPTH